MLWMTLWIPRFPAFHRLLFACRSSLTVASLTKASADISPGVDVLAKPPPDPKASMWNWLAYDLRCYRTRRGLSGEQLAKILNVGRSSVSRMENGQAQLDDRQALKLDREWKTGGHFTLLLWYARLGHDPDWFKQHVDIEARSSVIRIWENAWIPGLMQIEDYARATLRAGGVRDLEKLLADRLARQQILSGEIHPSCGSFCGNPCCRSPSVAAP